MDETANTICTPQSLIEKSIVFGKDRPLYNIIFSDDRHHLTNHVLPTPYPYLIIIEGPSPAGKQWLAVFLKRYFKKYFRLVYHCNYNSQGGLCQSMEEDAHNTKEPYNDILLVVTTSVEMILEPKYLLKTIILNSRKLTEEDYVWIRDNCSR